MCRCDWNFVCSRPECQQYAAQERVILGFDPEPETIHEQRDREATQHTETVVRPAVEAKAA